MPKQPDKKVQSESTLFWCSDRHASLRGSVQIPDRQRSRLIISTIFRRFVIGMTTLLLLGGVSPLLAKSMSSQVKDVFKDVRDAVNKQQGDVAVTLVTVSTLTYYEKMRILALVGTAEHVRTQPLADQMQILTLRHNIEPELLLNMDGRELFIYLIDHDLFDRTAFSRIKAGDITVAGYEAEVQVTRKGMKSKVNFEFKNENGAWRLDMKNLIAMGNIIIRQLAREKNLKDHEVMTVLLEEKSGRTPSLAIWVPPFQRASDD